MSDSYPWSCKHNDSSVYLDLILPTLPISVIIANGGNYRTDGQLNARGNMTNSEPRGVLRVVLTMPSSLKLKERVTHIHMRSPVMNVTDSPADHIHIYHMGI